MRTTQNFFSALLTFALTFACICPGCIQYDPGQAGSNRSKADAEPLRQYYPCGVWGEAVELITSQGETHLTFALPIDMPRSAARRIKSELSYQLGAEAAITSIQGRNFIIVNQRATMRDDQIGRIAIAMQNVDCE